jgi:hypothetical protein
MYRGAADRGLEIIAIAMPYDRPDHVLAMTRSRRIPYPVALDIDGLATRAFGGIQITPTVFLIAPDGRIVHRASGPVDTEELAAMIETLSVRAAGALSTRLAALQ